MKLTNYFIQICKKKKTTNRDDCTKLQRKQKIQNLPKKRIQNTFGWKK
jgi:hypothetical protein